MKNKEFDIVVFGATSFVGQILCNYLVNDHTEPNLNWAMAARSASKLEKLKDELGPAAADVTVLIADSNDEPSLQALCDKAGVIISTVGPYALYGELLVKLCARSGTDYCDLTGEPQWIKRMISRYESAAKASGARIVHSCGFDSIPSDLGVMFLQEHAINKFGATCTRVKMRVKQLKGGASGGTIASGMNMYKEASKDAAMREELKDPYSLCPANHEFTAHQHIVNCEYDKDFNSWVGSFVMAAINTRIVLRSNALCSPPYGSEFLYDEGMMTADGEKGKKAAKRLATGTKLLTLAMTMAPVRWLASRFFVPKPGEGPTPEQQKNGFYELLFLGSIDVTNPKANDDELEQAGLEQESLSQQIRVKVSGDRDPGYGSTAKMLAQAGISLRRDVDKGEVGGGFWTPATVFNSKLIDRLQDHAGMTFELLDE